VAAGDQSRAVQGTGPNRAVTATDPAVAGTEPQRSRAAGARCTRRRRIVSRGGGGRRLAWTLAALAALAAVALAVVLLVVPDPGRDATAVTGTPVAVAAPAPSEAEFGERLVRTDGWTVEIDEPRAHEKGEDANLPSGTARAVVVEVVLTNTGAEARDTAGWTVKAIVGSTPVEVLPEGEAPSRTVRPGASLTFPVTVPMPKAESDLQLEAAPGGAVPSLFVGTA
jgi:hypothetical protein